MQLKDKTVLVFGTGISGIGSADLLEKVKAKPILYDGNEKLTDEEVRAKLPAGSNAQIENQFISIGPGETTELQFDLDNVIDGWRYFAAIYYYSNGQAVLDSTTPYYTIVFPAEPQFTTGDVNDDGAVNIADVTALIDHLLSSGNAVNELAADVNGDQNINIADVTALIDMLLSH